MIELSKAAHRLRGQEMFQILSRVREMEKNGQDIIHFELGDPDFDTPRNIVQAACNSLKNGETHYAPSGGIREIKEAAAAVTLASRGFQPEPDQLLVCPGANVMIYYAIACTANPGEEVIVPDPGFVSYFSIMSYLGVQPVRIPLLEKNDFRLNPIDVAKAVTDKTRMIIINSPSNPTGALMTEKEIRDIYEIAKERNIFLLSDEIYARMVYQDQGVKFFSPACLDRCTENTIIVNGFSKSYAMTGWRLGVATGPRELIDKMGLLLETTTSCVSPFIQMAGVEALTGSQETIYRMIDEYRKRRDVMVAGLNSLPGISCITPKGAFYVFPNINNTHLGSRKFCTVMLEKAGVSLTPGTVFGENGEGYVRLCYVNSLENIQKGIERMGKALTGIGDAD